MKKAKAKTDFAAIEAAHKAAAVCAIQRDWTATQRHLMWCGQMKPLSCTRYTKHVTCRPCLAAIALYDADGFGETTPTPEAVEG